MSDKSDRQHYDGEYPLESDYPIYKGYWYLVNNVPWRSDRNCTVAELIETLGSDETVLDAKRGLKLVTPHSVCSCNVTDRELPLSQPVSDFEIYGMDMD